VLVAIEGGVGWASLLVGGHAGRSSLLVHGGCWVLITVGSRWWWVLIIVRQWCGGFSSWCVDGGCGPLWMVVVVLVAVGRW